LVSGFIEFIVEPSLGVCSDMLETILGPQQPLETGTTDTKRPLTKPWISSLAENKRIWKEQAAKGWLFSVLRLLLPALNWDL